jgi:hypothetical protein
VTDVPRWPPSVCSVMGVLQPGQFIEMTP